MGTGPTVFLGHAVGVVTGHLHGRPAGSDLLLGLGDHGADLGCMEGPERLQVIIRADHCLLRYVGERVTDVVRVRRRFASGLEGEHEGLGREGQSAGTGQVLLCAAQVDNLGQGGLVEGDPPGTRTGRGRARAPMAVLTTPSSITPVPASASISSQRVALAPPRRIPVAATRRIDTATRASAIRAACRRPSTSSGSANGDITQQRMSVNTDHLIAAFFGNVE